MLRHLHFTLGLAPTFSCRPGYALSESASLTFLQVSGLVEVGVGCWGIGGGLWPARETPVQTSPGWLALGEGAAWERTRSTSVLRKGFRPVAPFPR